MPLDGRDRLAELGDFLAALRLNGVPVGPGEIERLRHLFARQPRLDRAGLKTLLGALLIKTPAQRQTFEGLFAAWCPDHEADWPEPAERPTVEPSRPEPSRPGEKAPSVFEPPPLPPPPRFPKWLPLALAGLLMLATAIWALWPPTPVPVTELSEPSAQPIPTPPSADPDLPDQPVNAVWSWRINEIKPESVRIPNRLGPLPLTLLGALAVGLSAWLWRRYRRRFPVTQAKLQPYRGFGWQPLPPPPRDDGALIDARTRRQLVWNIERFVADDPTRRLNLTKTVDQTARAGGFVRFCFESAVYERAIWFWLDRHLESRTPREITAQLRTTLRSAGLDARQGLFTDAPHRVDWPEQPGYRPVAEEGQGRQALVAIFCDGVGLRRQLNHPLHQEETRRLLNGLQHWPRLCFVDCSTSGDHLAALFAAYRFRLDVVALAQLPDWLGGVATEEPVAAPAEEGLFGPARQWAAGVALGGGQADAAAAHTLRAVLDLAANPWLIDRILAEGARPESRRRLINWLLRSEPLSDDTPRSHSLARRALEWWQERYKEAYREKQAQENPLLPWQNSLASRRWQVEHALLRLYVEPEVAADRLTELADEELRAEIRDRLGEFAAAEHRLLDRDDDDERIYLTWRFADLPAATRHRLRALGFAGGLFPTAPPPLKDAPRLMLASTLLVTLALAAFAVAGHRWLTPDLPRLLVRDRVLDHPVLAAQTLRIVEPTGPNRYQVTLGNPKESATLQQIPAGAEIPANWRWAARENPVRLEGSDSVLLRAGVLAQPIRACGAGWPQRSLAVIAAPYTDRAARQLAIRLLDKGSADQVRVGQDWANHWEEWRGPSPTLNRNTQVLVILPSEGDRDDAARLLVDHPGPWAVVTADDLAALARAVDFSGTKLVAQAALPWRVLKTSGDVRLFGGPETTTENGIEWVAICPGTFTMGSVKGEPMAQEDEIVDPPRVVALSAFQIAATETTHRQYAQVVSDHQERNNRPVVNVYWEQARSFCQQVGGDLPTEAQWEYAARGGSRTPWSFGEDESQLGRYAWFDGNSGSQAHDVRQKLPNPLGLYDLHGNAWELARDWSSNYRAGTFVDPEESAKPAPRLLRGGSFGGPPESLRSAGRVVVVPDRRFRISGFRCVRVPPQH
ncbi:MAG TPA: formylglycine-generating enzyme family protein [Candidatus Contendobacter sp.]|nr:formylglycine-generating enzyme family protein [Candidatus Contendobacter sp.]HRZ22418.1 formylglycine-generating enzyme family protein [Candidatus Contendobacter sp.]